MKYILLTFAVISLAVVFVACKRESANVSPQNSGVVIFPDAGVSLDAGTDWKRIDIDPGPPVCPPTLVGSAGMVQAMLFGPGISDMQAATNAVRSMFDRNPDVIKNSYLQEGFTTDSGLQGQHISYSEQHEGKDGSVTELRRYNFIAQRQDGRCVAISYITTAATDSDAVRRMIQKSLKLQ